ncbi:MAG: hypothetical protein ABI885_13790 [Gammaproteobacteria bacterium]
MPTTSSETLACALIEKIELWSEFALGHKDLEPGSALLISEIQSRNSDLVRQLYDIHSAHLRGEISADVWARFRSSVLLLLSTTHFGSHWDSARAGYPEEFRAWMQGLLASRDA